MYTVLLLLLPLLPLPLPLLLLLYTAASVHGLNYDNLLEDFPLVIANSTPDSDLMEDLASFVSDVGVRRGRGTRRGYHDYILKEEHVYKDKILDLMKQVLYAAQDYMRELAPVLDKYRGDPGFRMKFIFNKLQQYTVDMRRIYTLATKGDVGIKVSDHVRLYQHLARKHVDVIYVVDHVIASHDGYMETLLELQRRESVDQEKDHEASIGTYEMTRATPNMDIINAHAQERGMDEMPPDEMRPDEMSPDVMPPDEMPSKTD